jgi:hypothetical protein
MIRLKVMGPNFEPILALLDRLRHPDLAPLAEDIRGIMAEDMRTMLLDGLDADGTTTFRLEKSTIERGRPGDGPPRAPRREGSRIITDYRVDIQQSTDRTLLIGGWRSTPFIHILASGTKPPHSMVPRDMLGITPTGQGRIGTALREFVATRLLGDQP